VLEVELSMDVTECVLELRAADTFRCDAKGGENANVDHILQEEKIYTTSDKVDDCHVGRGVQK
jgi:hypothetical protein